MIFSAQRVIYEFKNDTQHEKMRKFKQDQKYLFAPSGPTTNQNKQNKKDSQQIRFHNKTTILTTLLEFDTICKMCFKFDPFIATNEDRICV